MKTALTIHSEDGIELEARWDRPESPEAAVVFCHPHPQQGGTMTAPLMQKVTAVLVDRGLAVLRFNFRGVGRLTGEWAEGIGEIDDIGAAIEAAAAKYRPIPSCIAGWSFGAATSLNWQARERSRLPWVGIAPPIFRLPQPQDLADASRTFIVGDRDQFVTVDQMEGYAASVDGEVQVIRGSDHFFYFREDRVGGMVANALLDARLPAED